MRTIRSRSLAALAAGALLLAPLAGCGSDDDTKGADSKASTSASSSPTASATSEDAADDDAATDDADDSGDVGTPAAAGERLTKENLVATMVAAMREKKTAHMEMELGSAVGASADLRYGATTDMKMSMTQGNMEITVILVDGVMYMRQGAGAKYLKIDKDDPALSGLVDNLGSMSPEASVSAMKGALKKVEYAGTAKVEGDEVHKYLVTADTSAVADQLGSAPGASDLPKTITYTMFVDDDNLMRRIDMTVSGQDIRMTVGKWGEPVDIKAPPASQVQTR